MPKGTLLGVRAGAFTASGQAGDWWGVSGRGLWKGIFMCFNGLCHNPLHDTSGFNKVLLNRQPGQLPCWKYGLACTSVPIPEAKQYRENYGRRPISRQWRAYRKAKQRSGPDDQLKWHSRGTLVGQVSRRECSQRWEKELNVYRQVEWSFRLLKVGH